MKNGWLFASLLGGGVALGGAGVVGYNTLSAKADTSAHATVSAVSPAVVTASATTSKLYAQAGSTNAAPSPVPAPVHDSYAKIVNVTPVKETQSVPKKVCKKQQVVRQAPVKDQHQLAGTAIGGVLGGVIGHQVGNGRGNDVATVLGAVAGGVAGNQVQKNMQRNDTTTHVESTCHEETQSVTKVVAYDVEYTLDGKAGHIKMKHKPKGNRLPADNGEVIIP